MKRYFDIVDEEMTMTLELTKEGMGYTIEQISKSVKIKNLREIGSIECAKLSKKYQS